MEEKDTGLKHLNSNGWPTITLAKDEETIQTC
jgi:hypothetical protein